MEEISKGHGLNALYGVPNVAALDKVFSQNDGGARIKETGIDSIKGLALTGQEDAHKWSLLLNHTIVLPKLD